MTPISEKRWIFDPESGERALRLPGWEEVDALREAGQRFYDAVMGHIDEEPIPGYVELEADFRFELERLSPEVPDA